MKLVGARLGHHVDHAAAAAGELGRVIIGLEAEFLNGVGVGSDIGNFGVRVFVEPAIQHERGGITAPAAGRK